MIHTSILRQGRPLHPLLVLGAAAAIALGLAGCNDTHSGTTPSGMAPASALTGQAPSAAGGASGAGTQDGPSGGVSTGASAGTSPAP